MSEQAKRELIGLLWLIALIACVQRLAFRLWVRGQLARYQRPGRHRAGPAGQLARVERGWYALPYGGRALYYSPLSPAVRRFLAPSAYVTGYVPAPRTWRSGGIVTPASLVLANA